MTDPGHDVASSANPEGSRSPGAPNTTPASAGMPGAPASPGAPSAERADGEAHERRSPRPRRCRRIILGCLGLAVVLLASPAIWVAGASAGRLYDPGEGGTPSAPVAIVLGAQVYPSGDPSPWLAYRLDAAAQLYRDGKVDAILVSGDNGDTHYNEPEAMRRYLVERDGVPTEAIALDYAGFDTHATCVRAKKVFGVDRALMVSQDYHVPRAVALCRAAGVDADGVGDARAHADRGTYAKALAREGLALPKAAWDALSGRDPILGRHETSVDDAVAWTRAHR